MLNKAGAIPRLLRKYGIELFEPISTSMENNCSALLLEEAEILYDITYRRPIASLLYMTMCTGTDIYLAVGTSP